MRVIAVILGILCIVLPLWAFLTGEAESAELGELLVPGGIGIAFLAYGIGGQRLLRRIRPDLASEKKENGDSGSEE